MPKTKATSPARSQGGTTPKRKTTRGSRSLCSPALSTASGRLTSLIDQFKDKNMESFALSPLNGRSVLNDNTEIEEPRRKSWWKKLDENSQDVMEVLENNKLPVNNPIEEFIDIEVLSQEKNNYTLDLPESSDNESIRSIVLPQRRLFTQKENQPQKKYGQLIDNRESLAKLHKANNTNIDKTVNVGTRELFQNAKRSKPIFPAALLNISPNKTAADKTRENVLADPKPQVRNIFGNRPANKRKNMFADFIVSESEDEIPDIQPKVFGFQKKFEQRRISSASRGREASPASSITTDIEMDFRMMLPSSTMVENELEDMVASTPVKRARLSKLSEAKESDAGTNTIRTDITADKTKQSNKSASSKNKSKASPEITDKSLDSSRTTRRMLKNASRREESVNISLKKDAKVNKSESKITSRLNVSDVSPSKSDTDKKNATLNKSHNQNKSKTRNSPKALETDIELEENVGNVVNDTNNATRVINKSTNKSLPNTTNKSKMTSRFNELDVSPSKSDTETKQSNKSASSKNKSKASPEIIDKSLNGSRTTRSMLKNASKREESVNTSLKKNAKGNKSESKITSRLNELDASPFKSDTDKQNATLNKSRNQNKSKSRNSPKALETDIELEENVGNVVNATNNATRVIHKSLPNTTNKSFNEKERTVTIKVHDKVDETLTNDVEQNEEEDDENNFTLQYENDDEVLDEAEVCTANEKDNTKKHNTVVLEKDIQQIEINKTKINKSSLVNQTMQKPAKTVEESVESQTDQYSADDNVDGNQVPESGAIVQNQEDKDEEMVDQEIDERAKNSDDKNEDMEQENEDDVNVSQENDEANVSEDNEDEVNVSQEDVEEPSENQEVANECQEVENESEIEEDEDNESEKEEDESNESQEVENEVNESQRVANENQEAENEEENESEDDEADQSQEVNAEVNESQEVANEGEEDEDQANQSQEVEAEVNESQEVANDSEEDEDQENENQEFEAEVNESQEVANDNEVDEDQANESQEVEAEVNEIQEVANDNEEDEDQANESQEVEAEVNENQEVAIDSEEDEDHANESQDVEAEVNESQEVANDSEEDEDQANESQEVEAEVNESQEVANDSEEDEDQANESQEVEAEVNESQEVANDSEEDEDQANESQEVEAEANASQEVENDEEEESDAEVNENEEVEDDEQVNDTDEADQAIATDPEISDQDDNQTEEMEVDNDEEESDADESEQNEHVSHEERQIEEQNDLEPSEEMVEASPNVTHDTTGRHRKKNLNKSPEVILHNISNQIDSFTAQGRNTSVRKTKSMVKNLNIKPSLAPPRDSIGFSDGTRDSSAEGSGWDSHRTTRKTLRQTFGKDFTPRKSLRALVMEKSAKRQTEHMEIHSETVKFPLANSTEMPGDSIHDVEDLVESDHEVSRNTRLATLEQYLQKIKAQNIEKRLKMEAAVRNSLKASGNNSHSLFKIPIKPAPRRPKPTQTKPKKQIKSIIPLDELPAEIIADMKYKPPKRYQPPNASWATKRLYKFLETKLQPKYDYKARVRAEKLVETMYSFCKDLRRQRVAPPDAVDVLKHEFARLHIVRTHFDFYEFFHDFMPREVRIKVVPDIVNNIALPRHGVFSDILRENTVHG